VQASAQLTATATTADLQNMGVYLSGVLVQAIPYSDSTTNVWNAPPITIIIPTGGGVVSIKTIGAGSGTANYWGWLTVTPQSGSNPSAASAVVLGKTAAEIQNGVASNSLQGSGLYIANSMIPTGSGGILWESQRECFATAIGGIATITVLDQSYAQDRKAK
jgi:hypothetical protein